jgi:hypothetical protein
MKMILPVLPLFFLLACSKKKDDKDHALPTVTIISPVNNQQFTAGQTIQVTAMATDNDKVSEMHIHVKNKNTGILLRDVHAYPNQANGTVQDSFTAAAGIVYSIEVTAKDPAQNFSGIKVEVLVN